MKIFQMSAITAALACLASPMAGQTGGINGTVQTGDGKGVVSAMVVIGVMPQGPAVTVQPFTTIVSTNSSGQFTAPSVPAGKYQVCPQLPGSDLISPCSYQASAPTATVTAGQTVSMAALTLKQGVHVSIRLNDPTGMARAALGTVDGTEIYIGATGTGIGATPTNLLSQDSSGFNHDLLIPYDVPLTLGIVSRYFALADTTGAAIDKVNGGAYALTVPSGSTPPSFTFSVTGKNP